jgi:hypothetical protein
VAQQVNVAVGGMKGLVEHLFATQPRISGEWPELVRAAEADMIAFLEQLSSSNTINVPSSLLPTDRGRASGSEIFC